VAPPGAGKTTVVPLALMDEPWVAGRKLIVLEPRRLAARAAGLPSPVNSAIVEMVHEVETSGRFLTVSDVLARMPA